IYAPEGVLFPVPQDETFSGLHGGAAVLSQIGMTSIVQQNNVPAGATSLDSFLCVGEDAVGCRSPVPVITGDAPHYRLKPQLPRNLQHHRAPRAERRSKVTGWGAGSIGDCLGAIGELAVQLP